MGRPYRFLRRLSAYDGDVVATTTNENRISLAFYIEHISGMKNRSDAAAPRRENLRVRTSICSSTGCHWRALVAGHGIAFDRLSGCARNVLAAIALENPLSIPFSTEENSGTDRRDSP